MERSLEPPAGEDTNSPAHNPLRPALKVVRDKLSEPLPGGLRVARELARGGQQQGARPPLPTADPALDRLLAGGLARGSLVELVGGRSSGRFALVLTTLAAATGVGEAAVLIDLGDHLDPHAAAAAGADLSRLLWLRPRRLKEALASAEMVLATGFPLVVLDLGLPPVRGGRGVEAAWLRLARRAQEREAALLVSSPYRVSGTAAAVVLSACKGGSHWRGSGAAPRLLGELGARLQVEKHRGAAPGAQASLHLTPGMLAAGFEGAAAPAPRPGAQGDAAAERARLRRARQAPLAAPLAALLTAPLAAAAGGRG